MISRTRRKHLENCAFYMETESVQLPNLTQIKNWLNKSFDAKVERYEKQQEKLLETHTIKEKCK